ncbi:uncharacterized protein TM35_000222230 [Trypanosoma theileri]|uniref:RRM domain-containing protein n=1 Tax=Trypanosoma theileri TaxID=67003 RepID=A0A1X0NRU8_9TRYP|nr:uncharacterized protein TM35_000222230 [Trypanosoma theileri]ORC87424.1 hypothetical protein TM35_000222230 [Trypanosoma theileri]
METAAPPTPITTPTPAEEGTTLASSVLEPPRPIEDGFPLHDEITLESLRSVLEDLLSFENLRGHASAMQNKDKNNKSDDSPDSPAAILAAMDDRLTVSASYLLSIPAVHALIPFGVNDVRSTRMLVASGQRSQKVETISTATETRFGPSPHASSRSRCTLHIQSVDKNVTLKDVQQAVGQHAIFHFYRASSESIFVTFENPRSAKSAFIELQGKSLGECHSVQVKMRVGGEKQPHSTQERRHTHPDASTLHLGMRGNPRLHLSGMAASAHTPNNTSTSLAAVGVGGTGKTMASGSSNAIMTSATGTTNAAAAAAAVVAAATNTGCVPTVSPIDTYIDPIRADRTPHSHSKPMRSTLPRSGNTFQFTSPQTRGSMLPPPRGAVRNLRSGVQNEIPAGQLSREISFMMQEYMMNTAAAAALAANNHRNACQRPLPTPAARTSSSLYGGTSAAAGVGPPCPVGADTFSLEDEFNTPCGAAAQGFSSHVLLPIDAAMGVDHGTLRPNNNYDNNHNSNSLNMYNDSNDSSHNCCRRRMQRDPYKGGIYVESPMYEENDANAVVPPPSLLRDPPHRIRFWANRHLKLRNGDVSGGGSSAIASPNTTTPPPLPSQEKQQQQQQERGEPPQKGRDRKNSEPNEVNNKNEDGNVYGAALEFTMSGNDDESPPSLTPSGGSSQLSGSEENRGNGEGRQQQQQKEKKERDQDKVGSMTYADVIRTSHVVGDHM